MSSTRRKVFIAMSGGVDSSVAALLLKEQGYDCTGVFMKCYNLDGCAERDAEDARRVANALGIPFYTFDFEKEYKKKVVEYMIAGYRKGITPNPDVMCNKEIKFGLFLKKALSLGAEYVATGHYARVREHKTKNLKLKTFGLFEAKDKNKDQTYFLWTLGQDELKHCLFPVGDYLKPEVREMARKAKLPTAEKKDSQGICFLGDVDVFDFLRKHIKEKRGDILTTEGEKVGEHRGVWFYTVGQRHGLNIGKPAKMLRRHGANSTEPFYVAQKDVKKNLLIVAEGNGDPSLFKKELTLTDVNFISPHLQHSYKLENVRMSVLARVRYRQSLSAAALLVSNSSELETNEGATKLVFKKPQKFVAAGQSAVFYSAEGGDLPALPTGQAGGRQVLGGGIITG